MAERPGCPLMMREGPWVGHSQINIVVRDMRKSLAFYALGLLGAVGVSRVLAANFPGIHTSSVPALAGATVLLIAITQIASYMPARYVSKISPTEALRAE
jgi:hypothetical protein